MPGALRLDPSRLSSGPRLPVERQDERRRGREGVRVESGRDESDEQASDAAGPFQRLEAAVSVAAEVRIARSRWWRSGSHLRATKLRRDPDRSVVSVEDRAPRNATGRALMLAPMTARHGTRAARCLEPHCDHPGVLPGRELCPVHARLVRDFGVWLLHGGLDDARHRWERRWDRFGVCGGS